MLLTYNFFGFVINHISKISFKHDDVFIKKSTQHGQDNDNRHNNDEENDDYKDDDE